MTGISPDQIASGLDKLATRDDKWPPNAAEFRQLCMPKTIAPRDKKGCGNYAAYLSLDDPRHPRNDPSSAEYQPKQLGLESDEIKAEKKAKGQQALDAIKELLPDPDCTYCQKPGATKNYFGNPFCNLSCSFNFKNKALEEAEKELKHDDCQ